MAKNKLKYPLEQVLEIKIRRVQEAEKVVQEKKEILEKEEEKLAKYEAAFKKLDDHHKEKLEKLREGMDEGMQPYKIDQVKHYLKEVKIKRRDEERKVDRQKKVVETAQKKLDEAKEILKEKRLEVDKLEMHKKAWIDDQLKLMRKEEAKRQDEVGSLVHQSNKLREAKERKQKKRREKDV